MELWWHKHVDCHPALLDDFLICHSWASKRSLEAKMTFFQKDLLSRIEPQHDKPTR
jgi:hypothetical protein